MIKPRSDPRAHVYTPMAELQEAMNRLKPGEKIQCNNTKDDILRTQANLMRRRFEIDGADNHLMYIDTLLVAEAEGVLEFKK